MPSLRDHPKMAGFRLMEETLEKIKDEGISKEEYDEVKGILVSNATHIDYYIRQAISDRKIMWRAGRLIAYSE